MTTKKKLIVSISSMGLAVAAALGVTFGVLAAQNQAVRNQFSVTYQASNVVATASASYKTKTGERVDFKNGDETSISFNAADATTTGTLTAENVALAANNEYVIYTYAFKNDITAGGKSMTVTLTDNSEKTNVNTYYYATTSATEIAAADYYTVVTHTGNTVNLGTAAEATAQDITSATSAPAAQTVAAGEYAYFYIVIEIADDTIDASYTSTTEDNKGVAWALAVVTA